MFNNSFDPYQDLECSPEAEANAARVVFECLHGPIVSLDGPLDEPRD
ncbi:SubName: Full=Uncharacterized protein {ECO:0000313/EMBL:CCA72411.1} [Serendipita indica DSM 11827]|nr:SubName: Full=Uncharacterized protein {ECO:0000313/EMBL:CCA72411.1} [Serendipita indica DSM 11827]